MSKLQGWIVIVLLFAIIACNVAELVAPTQQKHWEYEFVTGSNDVIGIYIKGEEEKGWELISVAPTGSERANVNLIATLHRPLIAQR